MYKLTIDGTAQLHEYVWIIRSKVKILGLLLLFVHFEL